MPHDNRPAGAGNAEARGGLFTDRDAAAFFRGTHDRLHEVLGAHVVSVNGRDGWYFAVWAPAAVGVSVTGPWNGWSRRENPLVPRGDGSGVWEGLVPGARAGDRYRFAIASRYSDSLLEKIDPFATSFDGAGNAVLGSPFKPVPGGRWSGLRVDLNSISGPVSICRIPHPEQPSGGRPDGSTFRELESSLVPRLEESGFTHVSFAPFSLIRNPDSGSWGCGPFFAPPSGRGSAGDLLSLVDAFHGRNMGVLLDVCLRFVSDATGLSRFDGSRLYETDFRPSPGRWIDGILTLGLPGVRSFLLSSVCWWLETFGLDGIVVPGLDGLLRGSGAGGEGDDGDTVLFIRTLTETVSKRFPGVLTAALDTGGRAMVTHPVYLGGYGFDLGSDEGWTESASSFFAVEPGHRKYRSVALSTGLYPPGSERRILTLESAGDAGPILSRMPGDDGLKLANLRLLTGFMYGCPGKKLIRDGLERPVRVGGGSPGIGLTEGARGKLLNWVKELNRLYRSEPSLSHPIGQDDPFELLDTGDEPDILAFFRASESGRLLVFCNFSLRPYRNRPFRLQRGSEWEEILSSDDAVFGGSGFVNPGVLRCEPGDGGELVLTLNLPAVSVVFLRAPADF